MILGKLDLGSYNPFKIPITGLDVQAKGIDIIAIPGGYALPYVVFGDVPRWKIRVWVKAPNAVGQYGAGTQGACEFLGRQIEEMCRNPDFQPIYLQLYAGTGTVALPQNFQQPQDGWYFVHTCTVDYTKSLYTFVVVDLDIEFFSSGPPRVAGISHAGAALTTGFGGGAINWLSFPLNSTGSSVLGPAGYNRTGAEGLLRNLSAPLTNPMPFVWSLTISDWWLGGCHVFDAMGTIAANPVPTSGILANANWIEVYGRDHRFVGDVVITNGFLLWVFSPTQVNIAGYVWNTNLAPAQWQACGNLQEYDSSVAGGVVDSVVVQRVGFEEARVDVWLSSVGGGKVEKTTFRLQRGAYAIRFETTPLSEANTYAYHWEWYMPTGTPKSLYNSASATDLVTGFANLPVTTDYGYAAVINTTAGNSYLCGLLWQDTATNQPAVAGAQVIGVGDSGGPGQNSTKVYGVFAVPFATPQNLQAEAEAGTLGTGWSSVADGAASAGNTAKAASGTAAGNADTFGTAWSPPTALYDCWFRVKVTSAAGGTSEMQLGVYDPTASAFAGSTTYKANQVTTSYAWYRVAAGLSLPAAHNTRFRAVTTNALGTDWFIDEAFLAPITSSSASGGTWTFPQDIAAQFQFDRTTRIRLS